MARKKPGGGGAVLAGAAVVALFIMVATHHDVEDPEDGAHRLRRRVPTTDECRGPRAFAQSPELPWRLHDAFTTDCVQATFVAQYERGCAEMTSLVESVAPNGDVQAWLETAVAEPGGCKVCKVHAFDVNEAPKVEREKKRVFEALGGATRNLRCTFADGSSVQASSDDAFHAKKSTLVFRCPIPKHLGCSPEVSIADDGRNHEAVRVCHTPKLPKVDVALVAWTSASPYTDRAGVVFDSTDRVLKRWLAWHYSVGVRYFLIFESNAKWADPRQSKLWPAMKPFVEANAASLVPWATNACGGPHVRIEAGQRGGIGLTDFFGRPSQYAAQNSGLYRLREVAKWIAFVDIDEMLIPENATTVGDVLMHQKTSVAVPHVFYGRCPSSHQRTCAGKAVPSRNKLVVNEKAAYVWDHTLILPPQGSHGIPASKLRLAHLRADYAFDAFDVARFGTRGSKAEARAYLSNVLPHVEEPCPGSVKCEGGYDVCWCRDFELEGRLDAFDASYRAWYAAAGAWEVL